MCDGVGLSLAEAANDLALFNIERGLNPELGRRRVRGTGFLWGREAGTKRQQKQPCFCTYRAGRREAAAGSDPEALHAAWAEGPTSTRDTPNACVIGLFLFPAPAHQTGCDVHTLVALLEMEICRAYSIRPALKLSQ